MQKVANICSKQTRHLGDQLRIWGCNSVDSVFLTHAHIGHVDGLGLFGKETMAAKGVNLYCSKMMLDLIERTHIGPLYSRMEFSFQGLLVCINYLE